MSNSFETSRESWSLTRDAKRPPIKLFEYIVLKSEGSPVALILCQGAFIFVAKVCARAARGKRAVSRAAGGNGRTRPRDTQCDCNTANVPAIQS